MALTRITKGVIKPNENYDTHNIVSTGIVTSVGLDVNGNADISGNLSVGGVLTYEDVTSIDSVGIITARNDIHVGAGVSAVGVGTFGSLDISGDIDVDGHTNLDNVSIAGVTTTTGDVTVGSGGENSALGVRINSAYAQIKLPDGQTGANRKGNLSFGDNDDFRIVHDGHHNYITSGNGNIFISTPSANPVNIYNDRVAVTKDLDVTGDLDVDGHTNLDNVSIAGVTTASGATTFNQDVTFKGNASGTDMVWDKSHDNLKFNDNVYARFGTGSDLAISHNGSQSNITNSTGNLRITGAAGQKIDFYDSTNGFYARFNSGNSCELHYIGGGAKILTASYGAQIYGNLRVTTGGDGYTFASDADTGMHNPSDGNLHFKVNGSDKLTINNAGEIDINTGSGTQGLHFQASSGANANLRGVGTNYGELGFFIGNSEKVRLDTNGRIIKGHTAALTKFHGPASTTKRNPHIQVNGTTVNDASMSLTSWDNNVNGYYGPAIYLAKSGSSTIGTNSRVSNTNSILGSIIFSGDDGDEFIKGAMIQGAVDDIGGAQTGGNDMPGRLMFLTTADGAQEPTERLRITSTGQLIQRYSSAPYNNRAATFQSPAGINQTYISIINTETNGNCGITFGDHAGQNAGNFDGYINYDHSNQSMAFLVNGGNERLRITNTGQLLLGETSAFDSNVAMQFRKDNAGSQSRFIFRNRGNNGSSRVRLILSTLNRAANADIFSGIEQYQSGGMAIFNGQSDTNHCNIGVFAGNWQPVTLKNGNVSGGDAIHTRAYWGTSNGVHMEVGGPQSGTHKAIRFTTSHYGGERGYIGVTLGGTSYNSSSDYRMKQDVVDMTGAIDRIKLFLPKRFKWKEDPTYTVDGFLAHEASTVVPESVVGEKDAVDSNGDPEYQVMDNSKLVPVLTAALKEAIAKIEILETKVAALESS